MSSPKPRPNIGTAAILEQQLSKGPFTGLASAPAGEVVIEVPLSKLRDNPKQPRTRLDPATVTMIAESMKSVGQLQPIIVERAEPDAEGREYILVAGHTRRAACEQLGQRTIKALVRVPQSDLDLSTVAFVENAARKDVRPIDEITALNRMADEETDKARRAGEKDLSDGQLNERLASRTGLTADRIRRARHIASAPKLMEALDPGLFLEDKDESGAPVYKMRDGAPILGDDGKPEPKRTHKRLEEFSHAVALLPLVSFYRATSPQKADLKLETAVLRVLREGWGNRQIEAFVRGITKSRKADGAATEPEGEGDSAAAPKKATQAFHHSDKELVVRYGQLDTLSDDGREELLTHLNTLLTRLS